MKISKDLIIEAERLGIAFDAGAAAYELEQLIEEALALESKYHRQERADYYASRL